MPTILGGLHRIRATETTNFKVLVSPLHLAQQAGLLAFAVTFQRLHQAWEPRWMPLLTNHRLLHCPREGCGVGLGPQSPFLASDHGSGTQPTEGRCSSTRP
jgi:hypothetical protein